MSKIRNGRWGTRAEAKQWDTHPQVQRQIDRHPDGIKFRKPKKKKTRIQRLQNRFKWKVKIALITWYMRIQENKSNKNT